MATETESPDWRERRSTNQIDRKHWLEKADRWWNFATKWLLRVIAALTFLGFIYLLYQALVPWSVVIQPISVPKDMADKGFTPDVAALHLLEAVTRYAEHVRTSGAGPKFALHLDPADFVLPSVGLSFKAVVAQIRALLPIRGNRGNQIISGEITRADGKLRLLLRKNEAVIHDSSERADDLKALFDNGALGVFAGTRPYFEAIAKSEKNPEVAFELANRIIADGPSRDDVTWARNLLGLLLYQKGQLDGAVTEFKRAFNDDPRLAIAHHNLGLAYIGQGQAEHAIAEFRSAIRIDPKLGVAHLKLGDVLDQTGATEEAECEYLRAITIFSRAVASDPLLAVAHQRLGDALRNNEKADKANCAFQDKSILRDLSRHDNALAEYQRAADRDPYDAHIRYDLASELLENPDQVDKAIDHLREALESREDPNQSFDEFRYNLLKKLSQALYIKARKDKDKEIGDNIKATFENLEAEGLFYQAVEENEALIRGIERNAIVDKKPHDNAAAYKRRGVDLYLMSKFEEAVAAHKMALGIDETYLADRIDRGYARFALADFAGAADDFGHALKLPRGQADTIIWLYLSRKRSRNIPGDEKYYQQKDRSQPDPSVEPEDNASRLLQSNRQDWRIKLFKDDQLPEGVRKPDDVLRNVKGTNEQCRVYFYIGEWHALREEREAVEWLKRAETACPFDLVERPAATVELKRLRPVQDVAAMGASSGISTDRRRSRR
jgi:tetratricopeptide (TPR) repeat protein